MVRKIKLFTGMTAGVILAMTVSACGGGTSSDGISQQTGEQQASTGTSQQTAVKAMITLKAGNPLAPSDPVSVGFDQYFIKQVGQQTNGKVKIEFYPSQQIGKAADLLNLVSSGAVDMAMVVSDYVGTLPLSTVTELPGTWTSAEQATNAAWPFLKGYLDAKEFAPKGVKPLAVEMLPPYQVYNTKHEVKQPSDTKGLKLRSPGGTLDLTTAQLGATPVSMPSADAYEAVQRGTLDGVVLPANTLVPLHLDELVKYGTVGANLGAPIITEVINQRVWNGLPKDVQDAFTQAGEETVKYAGKFLDETEAQNVDLLRNKGIQLYQLSPDDQQKWADQLKPVQDAWVKQNAAKGLPAQEALDKWLQAVGATK